MGYQVFGSLSPSFAGAKLRAPRRADDRPTLVQDAPNGVPCHLADVVPAGYHSLVAFIYRVNLCTPAQGGAHDGPDCGVHARRVAAAGQYSKAFPALIRLCHLVVSFCSPHPLATQTPGRPIFPGLAEAASRVRTRRKKDHSGSSIWPNLNNPRDETLPSEPCGASGLLATG